MGKRWGDDWGDFLKKVPPDPFKDFQNVYKFMFDASFDGIFVIIVPEEPALLTPKTA